MSDTQVPGEGTPDATPTEALELADQQPIASEPAAPAPAAAAAAPATNHTRTILEVIGGVVAAGLIVVAGVLGFAVGHATGDDDGRLNLSNSGREMRDGPSAEGQQGQGQQGMPGEQGFGGRGHHDGDGPQGGMGMGEGMGEGMDPRGIDPDGDNWTGQNPDDLGSASPESTTPAPSTQG